MQRARKIIYTLCYIYHKSSTLNIVLISCRSYIIINNILLSNADNARCNFIPRLLSVIFFNLSHFFYKYIVTLICVYVNM